MAFGAGTTFWTTVLARGPNGYVDMGETYTNALFTQAGVFRRFCTGCALSHYQIYYVRTTPIPALATTFSAYRQMRDRWTHVDSGNTNLLGTDFELYNTLGDALNAQNKWTFCNYDNAGACGGVGFPRDCGPTGSVVGQWNSWNCTVGGTFNGQPDFQFQVGTNTAGPPPPPPRPPPPPSPPLPLPPPPQWPNVAYNKPWTSSSHYRTFNYYSHPYGALFTGQPSFGARSRAAQV